MVVGIWFGKSKPNINEYLKHLVPELKNILSTGLFINSFQIFIKFGLIVCDTPARSMIKGKILFLNGL